ncbi:MAG TPA: outer membrane beta-barrel protein [Longimicrobiales bacterium]|nr:outer membrane beta-barrel protein [Longimicrobiales bacterium]
MMKKPMTTALCAALLLTAATVTTVQAQARTWVDVHGLMYTNIAGFHDPGTGSDWAFDDNAFGLGLGAHHEVTPGLLLGGDVSLARPSYERRITGTRTAIPGATGTATIGTAMASGRYAYGGGGDLGFYLSGGVGTIAYHLEDRGEWNADFALRAGTGLEFRLTTTRALYLEWGRIWGYHERDGVGGGAAQHSALKLGFRLGT